MADVGCETVGLASSLFGITCDIFSKSCGCPSEPFINDVTKNMGEAGKVLLWHKHNA